MLIAIPTDEEIKNALKEMGPTKAPGPNGYPALFYQTQWELVKSDITKMVKEFFRTKFLLKELNSNFIALIPKVKNPTKPDVFPFLPTKGSNND